MQVNKSSDVSNANSVIPNKDDSAKDPPNTSADKVNQMVMASLKEPGSAATMLPKKDIDEMAAGSVKALLLNVKDEGGAPPSK